MEINPVPTLLGSGERLFDGVGDDLRGLKLVRTVAAPKVSVLKFERCCCLNKTGGENIPEPERNKIMAEYGKFIEGLKTGGHYLAGAKLDRSSHAVTVRRKNGRLAITDGPFTETKEQLGGYHVVECKDREEAIALAMQIPTPEVGGIVEVRAIVPVVYG